MSFSGHSIVIPIIDVELRYHDLIELGPGVHIIRLTPQYRLLLKEDKVIVGGYQSSLDKMHIGLSLEPSITFPNKNLSLKDTLLAAIFLSFTLRLITDIPFDIPFWFDVSLDNDILGIGRTLVRTFRSLPRYLYLLDEGPSYEYTQLILPHTLSLLNRYIEFPESDRIIIALEFAAIGFQMFHIPTRLVNQVMFMEILFSSDIQELSFQLASRISWYLGHSHSTEEREDIFNTVKAIYKMRSKIVHGDIPKNPKSLRTQMRQVLDKSES